MKLRTLDFKNKKFTCGGRNFYIQDSLSFNRYRELQRISLEFGFSTTFLDLFKAVQKIRENLNSLKFVEAAVSTENILIGLANLEQKDDPALRLCALFINETDEDVTVFDEVKMKDKIECWSKELDVSPFFHLAVSLVHGWMPAYKATTESILQKEKEKKT